MALFGPRTMSDMRAERTQRRHLISAAIDPKRTCACQLLRVKFPFDLSFEIRQWIARRRSLERSVF